MNAVALIAVVAVLAATSVKGQTEFTCTLKMHSRFGTYGKLKYCRDTPYNSDVQVCCNGVLSAQTYDSAGFKIQLQCCGTSTTPFEYNVNKTCCGNDYVSIETGKGCCGGSYVSFNATTQTCCGSSVVDNDASKICCAGSLQSFDSSNASPQCCATGATVANEGFPVAAGMNMWTITGGFVYDATKKACCNGVTYDMQSNYTCCEGGYVFVDPNTQYTCGDDSYSNNKCHVYKKSDNQVCVNNGCGGFLCNIEDYPAASCNQCGGDSYAPWNVNGICSTSGNADGGVYYNDSSAASVFVSISMLFAAVAAVFAF